MPLMMGLLIIIKKSDLALVYSYHFVSLLLLGLFFVEIGRLPLPSESRPDAKNGRN
jgi:hypothetical protein